MGLWEDEIYGKVATKDWIDVGTQVPTRQNDPIDGLFGDEKTDNLVAYWESIAAEYQIPVMAEFHGFDTEAQKTFRVPIDTNNIEKGLIKVKINQSERLRALAKRGVTGDQELYDYVLNDGIRLADQVITRTKVAKNEVMATGKVTIKENDLEVEVDYHVPEEQTSFTIDVSENADISGQMQDIVDYASEIGVTITGMLTSKSNVSKIRKNKALQTAINGNIGAGALIRNSQLQAYLDEEFGVSQIITNDLVYAVPTGKFDENGRPLLENKRYYPTDKITFFATNPGGRIGTGLWGDPPEVDMGQFYPTGWSGISPYVFISQKMEWDPAVLWTKASSLFMPVLYNPNSLFIATAEDAGA